MLYRRALSASIVMMLCGAGCGVAYQAAAEHRAAKMQEQLQVGMTPGQVVKQFGQPDIESQPDDSNEIWSYAKRANSNDVAATMLYTSAKEGDTGTFEDLKFTNGKLVSWAEAQHTMEAKEGTGIKTTIGYGRGGGGHHGGLGRSSGPNGSQPGSGSSDSSDSDSDQWYDSPNKVDPDSSNSSSPSGGGRPNPLSVTF